MTTLRKFSEKERDYHEYQARQNFVREQRTIQKELETTVAERDELKNREQIHLTEIARLKALLEEKGKTH